MDRNVGPFDARLRVGVGLLLGVVTALSAGGYLTLPFLSDLGVGLIAAVLVVEGATRRCLLYRLLGVDRCPVDG